MEGIDIVMAMDISGSMLAEDFRPNRLEAAKKVAADFIEGRKNDRMGLVVFSGEAFTQVPLTVDHHVLLKQLGAVKSGIIRDGTALGDGLATAINRIKDSEAKSKVIILLTDGVNNQGSVDPQSAAEIAAMYGIRLYTIGVGSTQGQPIPYGGELLRDSEGNIVVTRLDEETLRRIAGAGGGAYVHAGNEEFGLNPIVEDIRKMEDERFNSIVFEEYNEQFMYFFAAALIFLMLEMLLGERSPKKKLFV